MAQDIHIVVVGSLNMDLVVRMPDIPRPGETLLGGTFATFPGGKGANQAVAAARLGARVTMIGRVGRDSFGKQMLGILAAEGIDTAHVGQDPDQPTGVALIEVDARGENSIAVASGANYALIAREVESAWDKIDRPDWLVMPLETPVEAVHAAARLAKAHGVGVILNPAPAQALPGDLLRLVDVIVPNEHEAALMTGLVLRTGEDIRRAALDLQSKGAANVILTLGSQGVCVLESSQSQLVPYTLAAHRVEVVDTTAAGDCFVGALAVALGELRSMRDAASFACAAAALSVTRPGAQPSMPRRAEVDRFMREMSRII